MLGNSFSREFDYLSHRLHRLAWVGAVSNFAHGMARIISASVSVLSSVAF